MADARIAAALGLGHKWTLYGLLYTIAIVGAACSSCAATGHNRYQIVRTWVVMITQITSRSPSRSS
jgi:ferredoxin-type protein NapH